MVMVMKVTVGHTGIEATMIISCLFGLGQLLIFFVGKAINTNFGLFSAIVFVVAGPAIGFTLQQKVSMLSRIWDKLAIHTESNVLRQNWSRLKLEAKGTSTEESTLDSMHSNYIFGITTAVALLMIF